VVPARNLQQGIYQSKARDLTDNAKADFYARTGHLWNVSNLNLEIMHHHEFQFLITEIHQYLRYIRHLVGKTYLFSKLFLFICIASIFVAVLNQFKTIY
jgi:hypothetical protein